MQKILTIITILCLFSCTAYTEIIADNDITAENIATPILDEIFKGIANNNYALFSKNFDNQMRKSIPQSQFKITCSQIYYNYGKFKYKQYVGYFNQNNMTVVLYKGKFDKSMNDVLIRLVITKEKNKHFVTGFWLQ